MSVTKNQKAAIKAIVSCHETGKPVANYGALVVLSDDAGITYGAHQATHKAGSLHKIVKLYCEISSSETAKALSSYVAGLKNPALRHKYAADTKLKNLLKKAASEKEMQYAQGKVFQSHYFDPAVKAFKSLKFKNPLSLAVIYDSFIHGGWATVSKRVSPCPESEWVSKYVAARRKWLGASSRPIVRKTVYRMKTFEDLIAKNNINLELPITVNGIKITKAHLDVWIASDLEGTVETPFTETSKKEAAAPSKKSSDPVVLTKEEELTTAVASAVPAEELGSVVSEIVDNGAESQPSVSTSPSAPAIQIPAVEVERPSGWRTWTTTVAATLSSLGVSATSFLSWWWGAIKDPTSAKFVFALTLMGIGIAAVFGLFYLINRTVANYRNQKFAHEKEMKELEIMSRPDRYNVTVAQKTGK